MNIRIKLFCILVSVLLMGACGNDDEESGIENEVAGAVNPTTSGKTFRQTISVKPQGEQLTVTLTDLKNQILDVSEESSGSWLNVLISPYKSGSPSIVLNAEINRTPTSRDCDVTITDIVGDKVILTVHQDHDSFTIEDSHDVKTDEPAFGRSSQ